VNDRYSAEKKYKRLEDYGIIGNLETCALVGRDGSIDWLCLPYLESPSVFADLLDADKGGHLSIRPVTKYESEQSYVKNTNILQTFFTTPLGNAVLTDFMPLKTKGGTHSVSAVFRKVECTGGQVKMQVSVRPRFDYASTVPSFEPAESGILFKTREQGLFFQSPIPLVSRDGEVTGKASLKEGDTLWFVLQYNHIAPLLPKDLENMLKEVEKFWLSWVHKCAPAGCIIDTPWHDLVVRSGLILKLLSNPNTGAIAAAATTSLPEEIRGARNWDYRFAWIRDASFTNQALFHLGHVKESQDFRKWIMRIAEKADNPSEILSVYGLRTEAHLEEQVLEHLSGYEDSHPVRVGNAAAKQKQLDIYGELLNAIYDTTRHGEEISHESWEVFRKIIDYVSQAWQTKDSGIWEMRGEPRHFVYSKLMCWVAIDRGIKVAREKNLEAPFKKWEAVKKEIRTAIIEKGFSRKLNSFVQYFDSEILDATSLLISPMGFLPAYDAMVQGTIDATLKGLVTKKGLVYRYAGEDGIPGNEGCFFLCSFWLIKALILSDRIDEAESIFLNVINYISPLGLLSEEVDPETDRLIGNFPQAFSHIGLINSALYLGIAKGKKYKGPGLLGIS
jgi:GH15 family glucan-1,4-alpha-glucosidase